MKLYYSPSACSLASHIVVRELGLPVETIRVNLPSHKLENGDDFYAVNPLGYVPALTLDSGELMTEGAVILRFLADQKPEAKLAPPYGTPERWRLEEWLNFVATEVHKTLSRLFDQKAPEETKQAARAHASKRLDFVNKRLERSKYLAGDAYTVVDPYLFTVVRWTQFFQMDLAPWPALKAYMETVGARPAVKAALEAEATSR